MSSTSKVRERATHRKSRDGCSACKKAHRKCDLGKPICGRCQKAQQSCLYEVAPVPKFRGMKFVIFDDDRPVAHDIVAEGKSALWYFEYHTIPILRACRISLLWDYLLQHIKQQRQTAGLRPICKAIGIQHRIADSGSSPSSGALQAADVAYGKALHCLQTILSVGEAKTVTVLGCLLMCLLETLRGPSQALLSHIYCGVRILQESVGGMNQELQDASQLIRHYAVGATLFNPLSDGARRIFALLEQAHSSYSQPLNIGDRVLQLCLEMVQLMAYQGGKRPCPSVSLQDLRDQQSHLEQEVDTALAAGEAADTMELALLQLTKAATIALRMFLTAAWDELQLSYDLHFEDCRNIISLVRLALPAFDELGSAQDNESRCAPPAFSIGLFVQLTIMVVATQCRDQDTRAAALALLDRCPRREGVCDATLIKDISRTIKYCEEQRAGARGLDIPEHCRVHHHMLLQTAEGAKPTILRVFFSPLSVETPEFHDQYLIRD